MSTFIFNERLGKIQFFGDYLAEAFQPVEVDYGLDLKDKRFMNVYQSVYVTTFKSAGGLYAIIIDKESGEIGFAVMDENTYEPLTRENVADQMRILLGRQAQRGDRNAIRIFNNVFYILAEFIKKNPAMKKVAFRADDGQLGGVYHHLMQNKSFLKWINRFGFSHTNTDTITNKKGQEYSKYILTRK